MYAFSRRSPKSATNFSRSAGVRACQCRPRHRCEISVKSKIWLTTSRILFLRSAVFASFLSSESVTIFKTRSIDPRSWYNLGNGLSLHIILNDQLVRPAIEREKILARYAHFALWTEDADETAREISNLGLPCRDVVSGPTGLRQVFVKDPDGNMVEFIGPTKS